MRRDARLAGRERDGEEIRRVGATFLIARDDTSSEGRIPKMPRKGRNRNKEDGTIILVYRLLAFVARKSELVENQ